MSEMLAHNPTAELTTWIDAEMVVLAEEDDEGNPWPLLTMSKRQAERAAWLLTLEILPEDRATFNEWLADFVSCVRDRWEESLGDVDEIAP